MRLRERRPDGAPPLQRCGESRSLLGNDRLLRAADGRSCTTTRIRRGARPATSATNWATPFSSIRLQPPWKTGAADCGTRTSRTRPNGWPGRCCSPRTRRCTSPATGITVPAAAGHFGISPQMVTYRLNIARRPQACGAGTGVQDRRLKGRRQPAPDLPRLARSGSSIPSRG